MNRAPHQYSQLTYLVADQLIPSDKSGIRKERRYLQREIKAWNTRLESLGLSSYTEKYLSPTLFEDTEQYFTTNRAILYGLRRVWVEVRGWQNKG